MRIAFIIVYFGSTPWYFKFFNKSCLYNPDIDFILITDMNVTGDLADNITVIRSSLDEISKQFTAKLGFEINVTRPYKLNDLKPAYGLVFSDLIEGYDFWGYCDIDLVFGNIRSLITSDILSGYEVITTKKQYIAGFFTLFKNNEKINNIFKRSKDYRKVFQESFYYNFDECNWEWDGLLHGKDISTLNSEIVSISHVIKNAERARDVSVYWHTMEYHPGNIVWHRGNLLYNNTESVLFCHFIFFKNLDFKYVPAWKTIPERFSLNSFYFSRHVPGSLTDRLLRSLLTTARLVKRASNVLGQHVQWAMSYLLASRRIEIKEMQHPNGLTGIYKLNKSMISILMIGHQLHASVDGLQFPLLHKGAGKFVLAKYRFQGLINIELDFQFNRDISANALQITGSGFWKQTYFKIS